MSFFIFLNKSSPSVSDWIYVCKGHCQISKAISGFCKVQDVAFSPMYLFDKVAVLQSLRMYSDSIFEPKMSALRRMFLLGIDVNCFMYSIAVPRKGIEM